MNGVHPAKLVPSPLGDSVGHWEGDTLVIDTVGVKVDEFTSIDRFGTPQTEAMHIVERYRPIDGARARADVAKYENSEGTIGGRVDGYDPAAKKGLRLEVTMEDPKVFTAPLTGVVTYLPLRTGWREYVCADNPVELTKASGSVCLWRTTRNSDPKRLGPFGCRRGSRTVHHQLRVKALQSTNSSRTTSWSALRRLSLRNSGTAMERPPLPVLRTPA